MKKWVCNITGKVALKSKFWNFRHGAVVEKGGRILGTGVNSLKPKAPQDNKYSTHAEAAAIRKAGKHARGATIYSARVTKNHLSNAKPCPRCALLIKVSGIKEIVFSIDHNTWGISDP